MDEEGRFHHPLAAPAVTPDELFTVMPPELQQAFPRFQWTEKALWQLNLTVEELPVETFEWLLDLPIWRWQARRFQLSLRTVLNDPASYSAHHEKAERSDTEYPIHITWHRGHWVILDGYHRLLKILVRDEPTIKVVKVREADLAAAGDP